MKFNKKKEIEFKWAVPNPYGFVSFLYCVTLLNVNLGSSKKLLIKDYYIDTPDRNFGHRKIACRLRLQNKRWELTTKTQSKLKKGLATRIETTHRLPLAKNYRGALRLCASKIFPKTSSPQDLIKLFEIRNSRILINIALHDGTKAQLCFDHTAIKRLDKKFFMYEIELEFMKGNIQRFNAFTKKLTRISNLQPARISKVATALKAFSLEVSY